MDIRRRNLRRLLSQNYDGKQAVMAECLDMSPSFLSQLINGHRGIGEKTARKIEIKSLSAPYSMDMDLIDESHHFEKSDSDLNFASKAKFANELIEDHVKVHMIAEASPQYPVIDRDMRLAQSFKELPHYLKSYIELLIKNHKQDPERTKNHVKGATLMIR